MLAVDECYSEIYTAAPPVGALASCARNGGDCTNVLVFHSLSKRSNVPGLRAGFVAGDGVLLARFLTLRQFGGPTVPVPVMAAAAALWRDEGHVETNRALYRAKFDAALAILGGRFGASRPGGGFFLWLDVGDGEAAARRLWGDAALRVLPGAYMARAGADGVNPARQFIRVALVHDLATTTEAVERTGARAHPCETRRLRDGDTLLAHRCITDAAADVPAGGVARVPAAATVGAWRSGPDRRGDAGPDGAGHV